MKREFLMLAQKYSEKYHLGGGFVSEKLDGIRAFWDGGVTKGMPKSQVPFANTEKDGRFVSEEISTGLWSRLGHVIHAPDSWTKNLPPFMLDGELYAGRGSWQVLSSIVKTIEPNENYWNTKVQYVVFDSPHASVIFADGKVDACRRTFKGINQEQFKSAFNPYSGFESRVAAFPHRFTDNVTLKLHPQEKLPLSNKEAQSRIGVILEQVVAVGGEGVMVRTANSVWIPERTHSLIKVKGCLDDEGTVVGFTSGRETSKGSKYQGMIGAAIVWFNGQEFELSGFTEEERQFVDEEMSAWADAHPHERCPERFDGVVIKKGSKVTFKYRELSNSGVPKEARYFRGHHDF